MAGSSVPSLEEEKAKNIEFECITFGPYYLATVCKTEEVKRMIIRRHGKGRNRYRWRGWKARRHE